MVVLKTGNYRRTERMNDKERENEKSNMDKRNKKKIYHE